tara:strand:+ start:268 stop:1554 length:1287 start_codon:yes stop_codon:yes gene_type:complete
MEHNIYEEMYEHLLSEGLEEDIATSVVNKMYDREELHDVEYIDEGAFKAATAIGKVAAKMMGFGKVSSRAARGAGVSTLRTLNRRGSEAFQRGIRRANWTPSGALPSGTPAGVRDSALKSLTKGSKSKSGGLVAPGKGGSIKTRGKTAGLGAVNKVEPVTVKVHGSRMSAGKNKAATAAAGSKGSGTTYQGTRSGGQLPGKDVKALPGVGQASTRRNLAQQKLDAAAKGSSSVGTRYSSQGVRQLGPEKLSSKVKRTIDNIKAAVAGAGAATVKGAKKGASAVNKLPRGAKLAGGAALVGLAAAGLSGDGKDPLAKKTGELNVPKDTAPTTPPGGALADKKDDKNPSMVPGGTKGTDFTIPTSAWKPSADKKPNAPSSSSGDKKPARKLSKMERDARELKQMRARSLDRQGRTDDAAKLRAEIKKKYG